MLRFWFCRGRFSVSQKCAFKIWTPNPTRSIFGGIQISSHPKNCHTCHGICTWSPLRRCPAALPMRFAENTQRDTPEVLRLPWKMELGTSKVLRLPRKMQRMFWKRWKSIAPATQNHFRHVIKHVHMSRSATPATRNEATWRSKPPRMTPPGKLLIGTAIWQSHGRLRTVGQRQANTPPPPDPQSETGNPCYALGKN